MIGNDLKIRVNVTNLGDGVALKDIPYKLKFTSGQSFKEFEVTLSDDDDDDDEQEQELPDGVKVIDDNSVIVSFSTSGMDKGDLWMLFTGYIPDEDFDSGYRCEITEVDQHITLC